MLRSLTELRGYSILALDDAIGQVHDFYFDDAVWMTRYLVVDTGTWLPGRKVLISPVSLGKPNWEAYQLPVNLTKEQVENSPPLDQDEPISRQQEAKLVEHFQWPTYWRDVTPLDAGMAGVRPGAYLEAVKAASMEEEAAKAVEQKTLTGEYQGDPHLRSVNEVVGYHIQATDGEIGHVEDFIADDETWTVHYLVIDTRNWLPGKKVLVAPRWIEQVNWPDSKVHVDLPREMIKNSPEYDPNSPVNREYETRLYDYYGRPKYWK